MPTKEQIQGVLIEYAETSEFRAKLIEAQQIISKALETYNKPYVSYSGGKDSLVVLHLVLQQAPNILVFHWDYGRYYIPRPIEKEILEIAYSVGVKNLKVATSPLYRKLKRKAINVLGRELFGRVIPQLKQEGYDAVFLGLRKEESIKRKLRITRGIFYDLPEVWPIQNWSWKDVWSYIFSRQLPYLSVYDVYAPLIGWDKVRFVTLFDPEFDKLGTSNVDSLLMWRFKHDDLRGSKS